MEIIKRLRKVIKKAYNEYPFGIKRIHLNPKIEQELINFCNSLCRSYDCRFDGLKIIPDDYVETIEIRVYEKYTKIKE